VSIDGEKIREDGQVKAIGERIEIFDV